MRYIRATNFMVVKDVVETECLIKQTGKWNVANIDKIGEEIKISHLFLKNNED